MSPRPAIYCRCGRLLTITVRREGAVFRCPEHGIVWRYKVEAPLERPPRKGGRQDKKRSSDSA